MPALLGLDIGTLGVKGVVVTGEGRILAQAHRAHRVSSPRPGWAEQDAELDWWGDGLAVIQDLLATPDVVAKDIAAVGVCGLTPCLCPLDGAGRPLRPAILYSDNRALAQLAEVNHLLGTELTSQAVTPKWRWLLENEPEVMASARTILSSHNFVVYRLTGQHAMDFDTASILGGVFDVGRRAWDLDACQRLGLDPCLLPPLRGTIDRAGEVTPVAARMTGLPAGVPVIAGSGDTFPALVGCGAIDAGDVALSFGTTGLLTLTVRPLVEAVRGPHFVDADRGGAVIWAANVLTCGRLLAWYREAFGPAVAAKTTPTPNARRAIPSFADLDVAAGQIPPGSNGLIALPHLLGRRTPTPNPDARGVLFGLTESHTAAHLYRSLLEAFGYNVRQGFDAIRDQAVRVVATAGGAASPLWRQIVTDILEVPVHYYPGASGALGIAFLAGHATGIVSPFRTIKEDWLADPQVVRPRAEASAIYRRLYPIYCELDRTLAPQFAALQAAISPDR